MALLTTLPVNSIAVTLADGQVIEMYRVPHLPDVFTTPDGHVLRLESLPQKALNGHRTFRYSGTSMMTAHAIADTYMSGWENSDDSTQIGYRDGDPANCALENLVVRAKKGRGRPRSNQHKRLFEALALLEATLDLQEVAKATEFGTVRLLEAAKLYAPSLYRAITGDTKDPKDVLLDRLGASPAERAREQAHNSKVVARTRDAIDG